MLKIPVEESKGFTDLEPGSYKAEVVLVETSEGNFGTQLKIVFALPDELHPDTHEPIELWGWASFKMTPATKLYKWAYAIAGHAPVIGRAFDLDSLEGKPCRILVDKVIGNDGVERLKVAAVMPAKKSTGADACHICGGELSTYSPEGEPLCEEHAS